MTWVWFCVTWIPGVRLERIFTQPLLTAGWFGMLEAIPYAILVAGDDRDRRAAPEEAREPHKTIPRGMTLAQITLVVIVLLTWSFATAVGDDKMSYPLPFVFGEVWPKSFHLPLFSVVAIFGMIVSYNGMIYAVSRQPFSLGHTGYLPRILGHVHPVRRTPDVSI